MKLRITIALFVVLALATLANFGCGVLESLTYEPSPGTVPVDTSGDGAADAVAVDADRDGLPDLDDSGQVILHPAETARLRQVQARQVAADGATSGVLSITGHLLGVGGLLTGLWGVAKVRAKDGTLSNIVRSVQGGRQAVGQIGAQIAERIRAGDTQKAIELADQTLKALDEKLAAIQTKATQLEVEAKKKKQLMAPVN